MAAMQIVSDLHLEAPKAYDVYEIVPKAPYLALLGDICTVVAHKAECLAWLTQQLRLFRAVLFVPGNHEAYHSNWADTLSTLKAFEDSVAKDTSLGQFVLLDRQVFRVPDTNTVILGCSLFSSVPPERHRDVSLGLNDFYKTTDWDVDLHNEAHQRDVAWLNEQVADLASSNVKIAILSHWGPTTDPRSIAPRHASSTIKSAFCTDLSNEPCFNNPQVGLWAYGHSHYNCDFEFNRGDVAKPLRIITNQRGYYFSQSEGFDPARLVEL